MLSKNSDNCYLLKHIVKKTDKPTTGGKLFPYDLYSSFSAPRY